jgi:methylmalonyl-CoA mutase
LENLTETLINNTWTLFEDLEDSNGFIQAFEDGFVQAQVQSFFQNKQALTGSGDHVLLGTNKYPNLKEMMSDQIIRTGIYPEPYSNEVTEKYAPLNKIRLSELLEEKRLKEESSIA